MKKPTKFITDLSQTDVLQLHENHLHHRSSRVRNRSHAVLLSHQNHSVDQIAAIVRVDRETVSIWLSNWIKSKFDSLADEPRSGRPKTLTPEEEEQALEIALNNARFPNRQIDEIETATGKRISEYTLKALLKKKVMCGNE